jgi:predicted signal transduction protein with EAL and GGDEF domain
MMLALTEAQGAVESLRLSLTDELTGLPNRRALLVAAHGGLKAPAALGLMLLDLDGFKDINDSLGHAVGDEVLATLARRMREAMAHGVMDARLGGAIRHGCSSTCGAGQSASGSTISCAAGGTAAGMRRWRVSLSAIALGR